MNMVVHQIRLQSDQHFGNRLPPLHIGHLMVEVPLAVREAVSMALRNRSTVQGRRPAWLDRAADIRFVDHQGNGATTLFFEAPTLGESAIEIYQQQSLFPELRPDPHDTGFDLLGDVVTDVANRNSDSGHFDTHLLRRIIRFHRVFKGSPFNEVDFTSRRYSEGSSYQFTPSVIESAKSLMGRTPTPQRVRLVGTLDGIEASTQRFAVLLDTGDKVSGVFPEDQSDRMQALWRERVLVLGMAIYRASGRLLRVEAERILPGKGEPSMFSQLPSPPHVKLDTSKFRKPQGPRSGMAAIIGRWPSDESDEEIEQALEKLS